VTRSSVEVVYGVLSQRSSARLSFQYLVLRDRYEKLWERSKAYSGPTLQDALSYVSRANQSGIWRWNRLLPAFEGCFQRGWTHTKLDFVVLTDGQVWDSGTLDLVQQRERHRRAG